MLVGVCGGYGGDDDWEFCWFGVADFGDDGRPGHFRDLAKIADDGMPDADDPADEAESDNDELLECLLRLFDEVLLNCGRAGELEVLDCGGLGGELYSSMSLRTTIMERWTPLRARRAET